jgi:hypothetical protein
MEQSAVRRLRSTVIAVLQTAAENFFIIAFLLLTVILPACNSGLCSLLKLGPLKKIHLPLLLPSPSIDITSIICALSLACSCCNQLREESVIPQTFHWIIGIEFIKPFVFHIVSIWNNG